MKITDAIECARREAGMSKYLVRKKLDYRFNKDTNPLFNTPEKAGFIKILEGVDAMGCELVLRKKDPNRHENQNLENGIVLDYEFDDSRFKRIAFNMSAQNSDAKK